MAIAIHRIVKDNKKELTDRLFNLIKTCSYIKYECNRLCVEFDIRYCLSPPIHSQTNSIIER